MSGRAMFVAPCSSVELRATANRPESGCSPPQDRFEIEYASAGSGKLRSPNVHQSDPGGLAASAGCCSALRRKSKRIRDLRGHSVGLRRFLSRLKHDYGQWSFIGSIVKLLVEEMGNWGTTFAAAVSQASRLEGSRSAPSQ
jgi:hypothetical protein